MTTRSCPQWNRFSGLDVLAWLIGLAALVPATVLIAIAVQASAGMNRSDTIALIVLLLEAATTVYILVFCVSERSLRQALAWPSGSGLGRIWPYVVAYVTATILLSTLASDGASISPSEIDLSSPLAWTLTFCGLVLLGPLSEEMTYRGFIYSNIRDRMSAPATVLLVTLFFSLPHLDGGLIKPLLVAPLGLLTGVLRERSHSIVPGLIAHVAHNSIAFAAIFLGTPAIV